MSIRRYGAILLDAFGVLVHSTAALPGAAAFLQALRAAGTPYYVVTNDASRLPATAADRFARLGLDIAADEIITSGSLIAGYFAEHGLQGASCLVLGPEDTLQYVREAGGVPCPADDERDYDAIVVGDDAGYPFLPTMDAAVTSLYRMLDRGQRVHLLLPNPDLVYPRGVDRYGFTAGGAALLLEAALQRRYPDQQFGFTRLGKPHRPIFDAARRRAGSGRLLMVGDQLETDIAGALAAGIDAALLCTGISRRAGSHASDIRPTYTVDSLAELLDL